MKALLIDVAARAVREVTWEKISDLHDLIGGYLTIGWQWHETGDVLFVDDEGLLRPQAHFFRFALRTDGQPLAGNGVIVGRELHDDDAEFVGNADPTITVEDMRPLVAFLSREQADAWAKGNASEPAIGSITLGPGGVKHEVLARYGKLFAEMPKPAGQEKPEEHEQ